MRNLLFIDQTRALKDDFLLLKVGPNIGFYFSLDHVDSCEHDSRLSHLKELTSELFNLQVFKVSEHGLQNHRGDRDFSGLLDRVKEYYKGDPEILLIDYSRTSIKDLFSNTYLKPVFNNKKAYVEELKLVFKKAKKAVVCDMGNGEERSSNYLNTNHHRTGRKSPSGQHPSSYRALALSFLIAILLYSAFLFLLLRVSFSVTIFDSAHLYQLQSKLKQTEFSRASQYIQAFRDNPQMYYTCVVLIGVLLLKPALGALAKLSQAVNASTKLFLSFFKISYKFIWKKFRDFFLLVNNKYYSPQIKVASLGDILF